MPSIRVVTAGALAGFAVLCDYSGLLVLGAAAAYAWLRARDTSSAGARRIRTAIWYALGAAPVLLLLTAYQRWAFGHAALPSQHFMPAIAPTAVGYRGFGWPSFDLLLTNYFDARFGLFAVCPLLAVGLAAPFVRTGRYHLPWRETWLALGFFAGLTLFCASNRYSVLQYNTGIRYLVPAIPILVLLSLQVLEVVPPKLRALLLIMSFAFAWIPAVVHRPPIEAILHPGEFQLAWIRRIADYGALSNPTATTGLVLLVTAAVLALIWWPFIDRARSCTR